MNQHELADALLEIATDCPPPPGLYDHPGEYLTPTTIASKNPDWVWIYHPELQRAAHVAPSAAPHYVREGGWQLVDQ